MISPRLVGLLSGLVLLPLLAAAGTDSLVDEPEEAAPELPLAALQGTWVAVEEVGRSKNALRLLRKRLEFAGTEFRLLKAGGSLDGTFEIDVTQNPHTIDLRPSTGADVLLKGIYIVDGDTLRISWVRSAADDEQTERPGSFEVQKGNGRVSTVYERRKTPALTESVPVVSRLLHSRPSWRGQGSALK